MTTFAPRHCDIWPWTKWKATNFTPTRTNDSGRLGMGAMFQTAAANGDYIEWDVALDSGTWTLNVIWARATSTGIVDYSIGGTEVASHDQYGGAASNLVATFTGITVATPGVYALRATVDGKNASSSDYFMVLQLITLTRTGA